MCPDPQLLSIFMDGELPEPWKEKMETHLAQCSGCREKLENYRRLFEKPSPEQISAEKEMMEAAKDAVWRKLQPSVSGGSFHAGRRFPSRAGIWQRRVSLPLPAAAAAAVVLVVLAALWFRGGQVRRIEPMANANMILASEEDLPVIPADMNGVLQYLSSDGADILILRLPESRNFTSSGEPAIIKAADYSRRRP